MFRIKAIALITLLIAALTGVSLFLIGEATVRSVSSIDAEHSRTQMVLAGELINAEYSLQLQADDIAADSVLVAEIDSIREKLLSATPEELKRNSNKTWNTVVFNRLIDWLEKRSSEIKQHNAGLNSIMRAPKGDMMTQKPVKNWWGDAPDLLLAFAVHPMKDGSLSSTLIAQGLKGKELQGGKRYDEEIQILADVSQSAAKQFGHFSWNGKMYMAVVAPVMKDGNVIGSVVLGNELSRELSGVFSRELPRFVQLMFVYSSPAAGNGGSNNSKRVSFTENNDVKTAVETGLFHINSDDSASAENSVTFDQISDSAVYIGKFTDSRDMALSRMRWVWDEKQETDIYIISNKNAAYEAITHFKGNMIIAAIIILALGVLLIILLVGSMLKQKQRIKQAFVDAVSSGNPVDTTALALLFDENSDDIPSYTIKKLESESDQSENWDSMLDVSSDVESESASSADSETHTDELTDSDQKSSDASGSSNDANKKLYEEYMRLRKENNINIPMDFDSFMKKLESNTAKIKEKYHCEKVSFQVHVNNGNVVLKPKIIKK